jgi:hypothetical protein
MDIQNHSTKKLKILSLASTRDMGDLKPLHYYDINYYCHDGRSTLEKVVTIVA